MPSCISLDLVLIIISAYSSDFHLSPLIFLEQRAWLIFDTHELKVIREVVQRSMTDPPSLPCKRSHTAIHVQTAQLQRSVSLFRERHSSTRIRTVWATLTRKKTYTCSFLSKRHSIHFANSCFLNKIFPTQVEDCGTHNQFFKFVSLFLSGTRNQQSWEYHLPQFKLSCLASFFI